MHRKSIILTAVVLGFFSCSPPALAARHPRIQLTKAEAHKATELRLAMLKKEWPEIITSYKVVPGGDCRRLHWDKITCSYEMVSNIEINSEQIICSGIAYSHLNYTKNNKVNIGVILGNCESSEQWKPSWH